MTYLIFTYHSFQHDIPNSHYNTSEDRTSHKSNSGTATIYNYGSTSHKLISLSGASTDSMTYDSNGNILTASGKTYTYNAANRMATSNDGITTTNYLINFMGQRTNKSNSSSTTWFIYDENDNIIAEYDATGNLRNEYVYLNDAPIGLIRSGNLYYIYTDHLNTPRAITDTANNLQWTWNNTEAFGNNLPNEVVSGFKFNFRFPGQYFDSETNLNYNIHRDYNPVWGRYMTSDPLGLAAGINTYGYVNGNSLIFSDKLGLSQRDIELITNLYNQSIVNMINNGNRLLGKSTYRAWLNNFQRAYFNDKLYDCADQSVYTIINLRRAEYSNKFYDDSWNFDLVESSTWHPGHYIIRATSSNPKDSIIILDPWRATIPQLFPHNSTEHLKLKSEIVIDPSKPIIIKKK